MATAGTARTVALEDELRALILADPGVILDDREVMRTLIAASERAMGGNIVDMRGMAMERLETRLEQLEETHRAVIAAAYENLSGTNQIHRALLRMLEPESFEAFVTTLGEEVAQILRVDSIRLVLESRESGTDAGLGRLGDVLHLAEPGFVERYMSLGRPQPARNVVLRQNVPMRDALYGPVSHDIRSEALMRLNLGRGRLPGMLAMGAENPHMFRPGQGTDLLAFFSGVFERVLRRWLS